MDRKLWLPLVILVISLTVPMLSAGAAGYFAMKSELAVMNVKVAALQLSLDGIGSRLDKADLSVLENRLSTLATTVKDNEIRIREMEKGT